MWYAIGRCFDQGSCVPQRGEERNRKGPRFKTSPTEMGKGEKLDEGIDTGWNLKCAHACARVCVHSLE